MTDHALSREIRSLSEIGSQIEIVIMDTATSEKRELITSGNIFLQLAIDKFREASKL